MSRSSLLLAPLLLSACLPSTPTGLGASSPTMGPTCSSDPAKDAPAMDFSTAAGDSTIGAVPQLWSKLYGQAEGCKGSVDAASLKGLAIEIESNNTLGMEAVGMPGKGRLCNARVYRAIQPGAIKVYRVWSSDKETHEFGSWWTLEMPTGSKAVYRKNHNVCMSAGKLDGMLECTIRKDVEFAIGPTQSMSCGNGAPMMEPIATNQVYIPVRAPNPYTMWLENCRKVGDGAPLTE